MKTFEQALSEWLTEKLSVKVGIYIKPGTVQVVMMEYAEVNRWQLTGAFAITGEFPNKLESSLIFAEVQNAMKELRGMKYINTVQLVGSDAQPSSSTGYWRYQGLFEIRHRVRDTWTIES